jgi:hypothetical protein
VIEETIARGHDHLRGRLEGGLDELLADDVVFWSPIVFKPQEGKEVTKMYLQAAGATLGGDEGEGVSGTGPDAGSSKTGFRYTKQVLMDDTAVLEFETTIEGKYVNGVDIIRCDQQGKIVEFKVMIRPLQAVNAVHAQMAKAMGFDPPS